MTQQSLPLLTAPTAAAELSPCGTYRYTLRRRWVEGRRALWVMLNPSTADARADDPTIRRCIAFSRREGCGELAVLNLFALRATDPAELLVHPDPTVPHNDHWFELLGREAWDEGDLIIVAWGAHRAVGSDSGVWVARRLGRPLWCLGTTKDGAPRHPLYVRRDQPLVEWRAA